MSDELLEILRSDEFQQFAKDCQMPNRPIDNVSVQYEKGEIKSIIFDGWIYPVR